MRRGRRRGGWLLCALTFLAGCGGPLGDEPWNAPVESVGSITEWTHREPPGIGPVGGGVRRAEELLDALEGIALGAVPGREAVVERRLLLDEEPQRAWVRVTLIGAQPEVRAYETLVEIGQTEGGRWILRRMQERYHCVAAVATDFCQRGG